MKTVTLIFSFCILLAGNILAQDLAETSAAEVKGLKQQLQHATTDSARARIITQLSTAYREIVENDSCKKYATLAINFTKKFPAKPENPGLNLKYKMIRAKAIENFGASLAYENATQAIDTLQVSLRLWKETGDKPGIAMAYFSLAQAYSFKGDQIEAIDYFNKSLALFQETNNKVYVANVLNNISLEKRYLGMFGDALEYSIKSMKISEEIKDTVSITNSLLANGFNYMLAKNFPEALQEQKKAISLFEITKDSSGIARTYNDMGVTDIFAGKLDEALKYHKIALLIRKKLNNANDISISYNYIATVYRRQGKLNEALATVKEGIPYSLKFGDSRFIMDAYLEAGDIYSELKDYNNAIANYKLAREVGKKNNSENYQALALTQIGKAYNNSGNIIEALVSLKAAEKIVLSNDYKNRQSIYKTMTEIYVKKNDFKNGYENQLKFQQMSDSLNAIEKAEKITALTQKLIYENNRGLQKASQDKEIAIKESQIAQQKLIRNLSIAGLLIGAILAIVFFIRLKEKRKLNIALEKTLVDLKVTQKQLIQSEKMASLGELTAGVAHEIQNPLNFVMNFSEINKELLSEMNIEIEKKNYDEVKMLAKDITENEEKINHHSKRADAIVKGMLQHSRSSSGQKEPTDINALCDEYLRLSYHGLRAKDKSFNATMKTDFDESIGKINIVPQDIGRVTLNLLTNAFYAVDEKTLSPVVTPTAVKYEPTVSISTKKIHDKIEIRVADNGNGIPQKVLDKIFQPFFTTKPTGQGTGLGLSLSYDIIKAHGGEIRVETKENEGSTFIIQLPV